MWAGLREPDTPRGLQVGTGTDRGRCAMLTACLARHLAALCVPVEELLAERRADTEAADTIRDSTEGWPVCTLQGPCYTVGVKKS